MSLNRKSIIYRCLVALLCLVCMIVFTYSWFNRDGRAPTSGDRMLYSDNVNVNNSANLSMNTYLGTEQENGEIVYQSNPINVNETNVEGKQPGDKVHFKTKIINSGNTRCKATLILKGFKSAQDIKFGVLKPMNTLKSYKSETDVELIRNVAVPEKKDNNDGYVEVDWYVCFDTETITLGYLYLFGN